MKSFLPTMHNNNSYMSELKHVPREHSRLNQLDVPLLNKAYQSVYQFCLKTGCCSLFHKTQNQSVCSVLDKRLQSDYLSNLDTKSANRQCFSFGLRHLNSNITIPVSLETRLSSPTLPGTINRGSLIFASKYTYKRHH